MEYNMGHAFFSFIFLCIIVSTVSVENAENSKLPYQNIKYDIKIITEKKHFEDSQGKELRFNGSVSITFSLSPKPNENYDIKLNADEKMEIVKSDLLGWNKDNKTSLGIGEFFPTQGLLKFTLKMDSSSTYEKFSLEISYTAPLRDDMTGFYRSSYVNSNNKTSWLLTTHFEPIYARKAFPCFDRPDLKGKYQIKILVPQDLKNYNVLSNNPCETKPEKTEEIEKIKYNIYSCKESPSLISSYLVAFTISDFDAAKGSFTFTSEYNKDILGEKRNIKTYGRKSFVENDANLSLTAAKDAVTQLTEYLGVGYAYEKIDQIGIPDFSAGAMENWGLISYREKILFFNSLYGSTPLKQSNVLTITHELVHQWFGNLVTLASWDYIWLNEAFATYLQYLIGSKIKNPDTTNWRYTDQLLVNEVHLRAFETDGFTSSKALSHHITNESLIVSYFNDISYSKGASVLRMWDLTLPAGKFQKSLEKYINEKKENTATPDDLFKSFKDVASMNEDFFKSWTDQSGYPVVQVKKNNGSYILTQSPFFWENDVNNQTKVYTIPITFSTDNKSDWGTSTTNFLKDGEYKLNASGKWIIINNQQAGYYRVNYEKENWDALIKQLTENFNDINELNRAQIINDVFSLARSLQKNYVDYSTAMTLSKYLKKENSFLAWKTALNSFDFIQTKLYDDKGLYEHFKNHVLDLLKPQFSNLTFGSISHTEILKSIEISRWACSLNLKACVEDATKLYTSNKLNPETQEIVLCTVVRNDDKAWDNVFDKYKNEAESALKVMYLSALGCSSNKDKIIEYLKKTLNETSGIRKQDCIYVMSSVYNGNLNNVKIALDFIKQQFKDIAKNYGGLNPLGRALVGIAKKLNSEDDIKEFKKLVQTIKSSTEVSAAFESAEDALKIAESNLKWSNSKKSQFREYFKSGSGVISYSLALISICSALIFRF